MAQIPGAVAGLSSVHCSWVSLCSITGVLISTVTSCWASVRQTVEPPQLVWLCGSVGCLRWLLSCCHDGSLALCFSCSPRLLQSCDPFPVAAYLFLSFSFWFLCVCSLANCTKHILCRNFFLIRNKRLRVQLFPGTLYVLISCFKKFPSAAWHDYVT